MVKKYTRTSALELSKNLLKVDHLAGNFSLQQSSDGSKVVLTDCAEEDNDHQRWVYHNVNLKLDAYQHLCLDAFQLGTFRLKKCANKDSQQFLFEMLHI